MRFGLMNMYPVDGVSGGNQTFQMSQLPTDKKTEDAKKDTTLSQSVFATLDTDQNNKVNYSEAKSIFSTAQKSLENGTAQRTLDSAVTDATAKTNIKSSVLSKFNATEKFTSLVSKFNAQLSKTTATGTTEADLKANADNLTKQLDNQVKNEAQILINSANQQLDQMYNEAMMSAINDYNNGKDLEVNKDQNDNTKALEGSGNGTVGDIETKANTGETKFESTVFSKFDSVTADGSVRASQGEINIASVQDIVGNKLSALGADSQLASAIKTDIFSAYTTAKQEYSIDVGSKDVSAKSAEELERKSNEAIAKLDQKVQSKKAGADKKLEQAINKAYDTAYKANLGADLSNKPMLIQTQSGDDAIEIVPSADGKSTKATFNGKPASFQSDGQGGGTITAKDGDTTITVVVNKDGSIGARTEEKTLPAAEDGANGTETKTTTSDSETTTTTRSGGARGNRTLTLTTSGSNTSVSGFTFTPAAKGEGNPAPASVTVEMQGDQLVVMGNDGKPVEGASVTESDGKYTVKVGDKTYTVEIDKDNNDLSAKEVEPEDKPSVHQEPPLTVTAENGKKGLSGIAAQYETADGKATNWKDLAKANPQIKAPSYIIKPGDQLNIPEGWKKKQA